MSRIAATFDALRRDGRQALIPYITVGDPYADATPEIMAALADGGRQVSAEEVQEPAAKRRAFDSRRQPRASAPGRSPSTACRAVEFRGSSHA